MAKLPTAGASERQGLTVLGVAKPSSSRSKCLSQGSKLSCVTFSRKETSFWRVVCVSVKVGDDDLNPYS